MNQFALAIVKLAAYSTYRQHNVPPEVASRLLSQALSKAAIPVDPKQYAIDQNVRNNQAANKYMMDNNSAGRAKLVNQIVGGKSLSEYMDRTMPTPVISKGGKNDKCGASFGASSPGGDSASAAVPGAPKSMKPSITSGPKPTIPKVSKTIITGDAYTKTSVARQAISRQVKLARTLRLLIGSRK